MRRWSDLTTDQRRYVAAALHNWWRLGAPTGPAASFGRSGRLVAESALIEEGHEKYPEVVREAVEYVRERTRRFAEKRGTPTLVLTWNGPIFVVNEYDNWGQYRGKREIYGARERPFSHGQGFDQIGYLGRKTTWNDVDIRTAEGQIDMIERRGEEVPSWLAEAVRDWKQTARRNTLVPAACERRRCRMSSKGKKKSK